MLQFVEVLKRKNGRVTTVSMDGYTNRKTLLGVVHEVGREVAKYDENEGNGLLNVRTEREAKECFQKNMMDANTYCFELEEVEFASYFDEEKDEVIYGEAATYYFHIRFFIWDEVEEEPEKVEEKGENKMKNTITKTIVMSDENFKHCKNIVNEIEELVNGNFVNVDGAAVEVLEDEDGEYIMVDGERRNADDFDPYTLYDYFNDVFDIEYTVNANLEYCGVRLMVACGGPNIYVDTMTKKVQLYWWSDYAEYELASEAVNAIDDVFEDYYNCIR